MPKSFGDLLSIFGNNPGSGSRNERPNIYKVHVVSGLVSDKTRFIKDSAIQNLDRYLLGGAIADLHSGSSYVHKGSGKLVQLAEHLDPSLKRFRQKQEQKEIEDEEVKHRPILSDKEWKHEGPLARTLTPVHTGQVPHPTNGFYRAHYEAVHVPHVGYASSTYHTAGSSSSNEIHAAFG
jgi:hypothetical protein